jgi:MarR family
MTFYNNNNFSQSKIDGKFYALKNEEHLRACRELTPAQLIVFYHLKSLDPYGDRPLNITIIGIARLLKLSRATVSRALKALDKLGWLELELIYVRVSVRMRESNKIDLACLSSDISDTLCDIPDTLCDISDTLCDISDTVTTLKPASFLGFKPPKTIKTIKTIKTLSLPEKEREKFLEFANKKVDELPKRPQLPKRWIEKHHDELWAEYQELEQRKEANEQRRKETIENQPETVVDPRIASALENGEILEIDKLYKMFRVQEGWWHWHELDQWRAKQSMADYQATNEAMSATKQLIAKSADIPI